MRNIEKYFLNRSPYDILVNIAENSQCCALVLIGSNTTPFHCEFAYRGGNCKNCIQKWLNEEDG